MRLIVHPIIHLRHRAPQQRMMNAKRLMHYILRGFVNMMAGLGCFSYEVVGASKLQREGLFILANHPSLIDVVFMIALTHRADCVVKAALLRNFLTAAPVRGAGYIANNLEGVAFVEACIESVQEKNNLILFPEGTRTPPTQQITLQRGAAHVAVRARLNITPVLISCVPPVLTKGSKWYHVSPQRPHFKIEVRDDIGVLEFVVNNPNEAIAARRLTEYLTRYFSEELRHADA